jgi:hypothetical protein
MVPIGGGATAEQEAGENYDDDATVHSDSTFEIHGPIRDFVTMAMFSKLARLPWDYVPAGMKGEIFPALTCIFLYLMGNLHPFMGMESPFNRPGRADGSYRAGRGRGRGGASEATRCEAAFFVPAPWLGRCF